MRRKLLALTFTLFFSASALAQNLPLCGQTGSPGYCGGGGGIAAYEPAGDPVELSWFDELLISLAVMF